MLDLQLRPARLGYALQQNGVSRFCRHNCYQQPPASLTYEPRPHFQERGNKSVIAINTQNWLLPENPRQNQQLQFHIMLANNSTMQ